MDGMTLTKPRPPVKAHFAIAVKLVPVLVGLLFGGPIGAAFPTPYALFWVQRTDVGSPGPRSGHALAYDSDRGVTILFGGQHGDINDTWEYDGHSWKKITIDGPVPSPRSRHAMCYDNSLRQVILFGGIFNNDLFDDVWNYESTGPQRGRWIHRAEALSPGGRFAHTMVFDYFAGRAIVAGGSPAIAISGPERQTAETWEWNNSTGQWFLSRQTVGFYAGKTLGAGLSDHMMLYDYRRREAVVLGGIGPFGTKLVANGRMFFVSGDDSGRNLECGPTVAEGAIVYDGFHDIYVQFGGTHYFRGEYAPNRAEPSKGTIFHRSLAGFPCSYRPADVTVNYGDAVLPDLRGQCAMVYDEKRRVTVLFGGSVPGDTYGDTWEFVTRDSREIWVHFDHPGREIGTFELPYNTLAEGTSHVASGGTLKIKAGSTPETPQLVKPVTIEAVGGPVTIGQR